MLLGIEWHTALRSNDMEQARALFRIGFILRAIQERFSASRTLPSGKCMAKTESVSEELIVCAKLKVIVILLEPHEKREWTFGFNAGLCNIKASENVLAGPKKAEVFLTRFNNSYSRTLLDTLFMQAFQVHIDPAS